tara:strand:+ start:447 stop:749 length:303 start_codon:yes stop_codon:yes gene_type:complete
MNNQETWHRHQVNQLIEGLLNREFDSASWMKDSACKDVDPSIFFVERGESGEEAKAICATCPVKQECLDYAIKFNERVGIWGGMSDKQIRQEVRRRKQVA